MISDSMSITGPSVSPGIVGNPSPTSSGALQLINSAQSNFASSIVAATKKMMGRFSVSGATVELTKAASGATRQVGQSVGTAITTTAKSASSGIKWGIAAVVIIAALFLAVQVKKVVS